MHSLHTVEKQMNRKKQEVLKAVRISSGALLNHTALMKLNKDPLAILVEDLFKLLDSNLEMCKSAASKIDELKSEQLHTQKQLLHVKEEQLKSVENVVKTEMQSWADVAKKNINQDSTVSTKAVKEAVKSVNAEELRSRNLIIYNASENHKDGALRQLVAEIVVATGTSQEVAVPDITRINRVGAVGSNSSRPRPIKVELRSSEEVQKVLRNSYKLNEERAYKHLYVAPDRTREERLAHSKLVKQMKELISSDSSKHYFIRNGKVNCVDKAADSDSDVSE